MKVSRRSIYTCRRLIPSIHFTQLHKLTAFGALVVFMKVFDRLHLWTRLERCFAHFAPSACYTHGVMMRCLIVHILLGRRQLRERDFYAHAPLVLQCLGLRQMPSVPTLSRFLARTDETSVHALRQLNVELVLERLRKLRWRTLTLDSDGSVLSTSRHAEGTAVGYNKQKKGARSYYPLFCHLAQTGQVLDVHHRSGQLHDTNGAAAFVRACVQAVRQKLGAGLRLEVRMDASSAKNSLRNSKHFECFTPSAFPLSASPSSKRASPAASAGGPFPREKSAITSSNAGSLRVGGATGALCW